MTLEEMIAVLQAAKEGKKIERKLDGKDIWVPAWGPLWNFADCRYRIAPSKEKKPLGPEDFPPGTLLRCSKEWPKHGWFTYAVIADGLAVRWPDICRNHTFSELITLYLERSHDGGKTWLPCYKEE